MPEAAGDLPTRREGQKVVGINDLPIGGLNLPAQLEGGDIARREEAHGLCRAAGSRAVNYEIEMIAGKGCEVTQRQNVGDLVGWGRRYRVECARRAAGERRLQPVGLRRRGRRD